MLLRPTQRSFWIRSAVIFFSIVLTVVATCQTTQAQQGTVVSTFIDSQALEGNRLDAPTRRRARVYLPAGYESSTKRYPVVYFLHGGSGDENTFFDHQGHRTADRLINNDELREMIVVGVDGSTSSRFFGGSRFVNSQFFGNYETYVVQDVVQHIDATYRTINDRDSRGVFGRSMGGAGALRLAMLHSDTFGAAYIHTPGYGCYSHPDCNIYLDGDQAIFSDVLVQFAGGDVGRNLDGVKTPSDIRGVPRGPVFGQAAAFSSNLDNTPLLVDLPFEVPSLDIIPEVRDRWYEYDIFKLLEKHVNDLSSLRGLGLDAGNRDEFDLARGTEAFHRVLDDLGVSHQFELYSGGHSDRMPQRIAESLTFLSDSLVTDFGDLNGDGKLGAEDIDLLNVEIRRLTNDPRMDLNGDGMVDPLDRDYWISDSEGAYTYYGDSNLDGEFNSGDFVDVFQAGRYETRTTAGWSQGDWNGDAVFDSSDFITAFQDGGYESGPRTPLLPVPEPGGLATVLSVLVWVTGSRCMNRQQNKIND